METQFYIIHHKHRHGHNISVVECDHEPTLVELIEKRVVENFEPELEEWIEITSTTIERI